MGRSRRDAHLHALNNSPRAGYLHCPSGLKAAARGANDIAQEVQAENELLMTEAELHQAIEEVLAAKMHDLEEKHQHLQAAHRQLRLDNESLEAVIEQCNLAVTIARRDVHRLEAQLRKFQRRPLLTRKQRQQLQILKQTGVSIEVLRRWADSNCSRLDTHGRPGGSTVQPTPRPSPPEPTPGPSPPEPCGLFIPTQEASPGQPAARTMCDPRVWDAHGTWEKHEKQICAMGSDPTCRASPVSSALLTSLLFMPAQVIKVPGDAVLRGCKKTKRKLLAHFQLRAGIHSQLRVIASMYVLRIFLTCLVGHSTPGYPSAPTPPAVQPPRALDAAPLPPLPLRAPAQPASMEMDWAPEAEPEPDPEPEPEPEPVPAPPTLRPPSARIAARHPPPAAPTGPPMPLDCEDPVLLQQLKVFCLYFANSKFLTPYNQLQRRLGRAKQNKHFNIKPAFDDPSNQELLAKLQQLGSANFTGDHNTISHHSMQLAVAMQQHYSNILNTDSPELQAPHLDKAHVNDLMEEAAKQRRLLALEEGDSLQDTVPLPCRMRHAVHVCRAGVHFVKVDSRVLHEVCQQLGLTREKEKVFCAEPARSNHWDRWFSTGKLANQGFEFERTVETDGVSVCVHYTRLLPPPPAPPSAAGPSSSNSSPAAAPGVAAGLPRIGKGLAEQREFVYNPATQIGVGIDPGVTQAVSAASGVWDPMTGQLQADQLRRWKLTKGEVKHGSGLNNARRNTELWLAPIKPHLQHLAAASSAGTSLEANLKHITVTLATWDAVWEVYLDPKWAEQRLRLYGAQDRTLEQFFKKLEEGMAEVSMERHGHAKQLVVFFGAATIGTGGGWGADAVLRACCKVVCRTRGTDQRRGRVVLVDEHRTSRVSSAVNGQQPLAPRKSPQAPRSSQAATQPAASEPGPSTPLPAKRTKRTKAEPEAAEPTNGKGKASKAKPAPQPGRWVDRDCNAALNMQRIGESRWRPLELCYWPEQGALPAKGKEYPGLGYKRLRDKPPKAQRSTFGGAWKTGTKRMSSPPTAAMSRQWVDFPEAEARSGTRCCRETNVTSLPNFCAGCSCGLFSAFAPSLASAGVFASAAATGNVTAAASAGTAALTPCVMSFMSQFTAAGVNLGSIMALGSCSFTIVPQCLVDQLCPLVNCNSTNPPTVAGPSPPPPSPQPPSPPASPSPPPRSPSPPPVRPPPPSMNPTTTSPPSNSNVPNTLTPTTTSAPVPGAASTLSPASWMPLALALAAAGLLNRML
ncbi:hypothetical protein QJQ45_011269 [Haematococcus lacustris]|nr:hypothetical protein QJQ45_011269 [Haematococcus lacustris]